MDHNLTFRLATKNDLPVIIQLLADDSLGATREQATNGVSEQYKSAFEKIITDPNQELTIAEMNRQTVATFHLTRILQLDS